MLKLLLKAFEYNILLLIVLLIIRHFFAYFNIYKQALISLMTTKTPVESANQNIKIKVVGDNKRFHEDEDVVKLTSVKRLKVDQSTIDQIAKEKKQQMKALVVKLEILERLYAEAVAAHQKLLTEEREFLSLISAKYQKPFSMSTLKK